MHDINQQHYTEIVDALIQYFPDAMFMSEWKDGYTQSDPGKHWVYVVTDMDAKLANEQLDKFDEEWWLENSRRFEIGVNLRFVPIRESNPIAQYTDVSQLAAWRERTQTVNG